MKLKRRKKTVKRRMLAQEGIVTAFKPDGRFVAVPRIDNRAVRQNQQLLTNRGQKARQRPTWKIGAAYAAVKKRVTGNDATRGRDGLARDRIAVGVRVVVCRVVGTLFHKQADASGCVAGRVQYVRRETAAAQRVAFLNEVSDARRFGNGDSEPSRLHVERSVQGKVRFMDQHGRASGTVQRRETSHVIDVRVSAHDGNHFEFVAANYFHDAFDFVAGIDYERFVRGGIPEDRTIALQESNRHHFVNEVFRHLQEVYQSDRIMFGGLLIGRQTSSDARADSAEQLRTAGHRVQRGIDGRTKPNRHLSGMNAPVPFLHYAMTASNRHREDGNRSLDGGVKGALFEGPKAAIRTASALDKYQYRHASPQGLKGHRNALRRLPAGTIHGDIMRQTHRRGKNRDAKQFALDQNAESPWDRREQNHRIHIRRMVRRNDAGTRWNIAGTFNTKLNPSKPGRDARTYHHGGVHSIGVRYENRPQYEPR